MNINLLTKEKILELIRNISSPPSTPTVTETLKLTNISVYGDPANITLGVTTSVLKTWTNEGDIELTDVKYKELIRDVNQLYYGNDTGLIVFNKTRINNPNDISTMEIEFVNIETNTKIVASGFNTMSTINYNIVKLDYFNNYVTI